MFQNLPISKAQKESLLLDFVEKSVKTNPITFPAHTYATRVTDKLSVVATSIPARHPNIVAAARKALAQTPSNSSYSPFRPPPPPEASGNEDEVELLDCYEQPEEGERLSPTPEDDASGANTGDEDDGIHPSRQPITPTHTGLLVPWAEVGTPLRAIP